MRIDKKYKISNYGKYYKGINDCPHCNFHLLRELDRNDLFHNHCCGFCDTNLGMLMVMECPQCFKKWSFHATQDFYDNFLLSIDWKTNKHF